MPIIQKLYEYFEQFKYRPSLEKSSDQLIVTLYTLYISPSRVRLVVLENAQFEFPGFSINVPRIFRVDIHYTYMYISLCIQIADLNPFRGKHCIWKLNLPIVLYLEAPSL